MEAETLVPSLHVYRALLSATAARRLVVSDASLRTGVLLDVAQQGGRLGAEDFDRQVLASEHLQKVRDLRLLRRDRAWILEIEGAGDLTMEQLAATARADMFVETFGRELIIRPAGVPS